ncbi:ABC transporter ATP-binding protein/permease [Streptomyces marianii]|uniref:ABC transporter ATP-binding protein/permease n=1 Tax=Streptomyces marianii TaxID=1817406 RepID=A0A5R9E8I7_9ACTN|nr:ABC transporter ATP-binding protein/permease [Streptomyces marianii]TLQ44534.1 ABC transporter ATP-binding protein/permease [Streptomyces marianii]
MTETLKAVGGLDARDGRREPAVRMAGLAKSFGDVQAVVEGRMEVFPGEVVAVLGPNGAGKTTSLHCLLGLRQPDAGVVELMGGSPTSPQVRAQCGVVLQNSGLPGTLRVRELVDLFRAYYPDPMDTQEVLDLAGLADLAERFFGELSGGQQQRVYLGLALCGKPRVLFLDEPSVGLDSVSRRQLWSAVQRVAAEGTAVLLTTHYLEEADALADRIVLFASGRTVFEGSSTEMKSHFRRRLISLRPAGEPDLEAVRDSGAEDIEYVDGMLSLTTARTADVLRTLLGAEPVLNDLEVRGISLEEAVEEVLRTSSADLPAPAPATSQPRPSAKRDRAAERLDAASWARMVRAQTKAEFLKLKRDMAFVLTTCLLPTIFFAFFGLSQARNGDPEAMAYTVAGFSAYGAVGVGLFGFGVGIAAERGFKWDLLIRATPMSPSAYLSSRIVPAAVFTLFTLCVLAVFSTSVAGVRLSPAQWAALMGGLTLGNIVFVAMGLAIGYNLSPKAAGPVSTVVYLLLSFASGMFVPLNQLPSLAESLAPFLPTWHFARIGWGAVGIEPGFGLTSLLVLTAYTAAFTALAVMGYRRELKTRFL